LQPPAITTQPLSQAAGEGGIITLNVGASGSLPLTYQWLFNGAGLADSSNVIGSATTSLTLSNIQAAQVGRYSVRVANAAGTVTSAEAILSLLTLADAVDSPSLTFSPGGNASWIAETSVTHDGVDAARSGFIADGENTRLETWVTGPGTVSFWWKVSSEPVNDQFRFYVGATEQARITGEVDWQLQTYTVPAGVQLLKWRYSKSGGSTAGLDQGWVDQIRYTPDTAPSPLGPVVDPGQPPPDSNPIPPGTPSSPIAARIVVSGNKAVLTWTANANKVYQVFYKDRLFDSEWTLVDGEVLMNWQVVNGEVVVSDTVVATVEDVLGGQTRFYRVLEY
jgi:hypothetical protein